MLAGPVGPAPKQVLEMDSGEAVGVKDLAGGLAVHLDAPNSESCVPDRRLLADSDAASGKHVRHHYDDRDKKSETELGRKLRYAAAPSAG